MTMHDMQEFGSTQHLFGGNAPFIEELYERYLADPASVRRDWRGYFDELQQAGRARDVAHAPSSSRFVAARAKPPRRRRDGRRRPTMHKQVLVLQLISKYRTLGHAARRLDPLKRSREPLHPRARPALLRLHRGRHGHRVRRRLVQGRPAARCALRDLIAGAAGDVLPHIGAEYMYITDTPTKRLDPGAPRADPLATPHYDADEKQAHPRAAHRGRDARALPAHASTSARSASRSKAATRLIPMLDELIQRAGAAGVQEIVIGMAHRGRLNVLVNMLGKMPADLFSEFEGKHDAGAAGGRREVSQGLLVRRRRRPGGPVHLTLAFNPSHLEIVNPVVEGRCARASTGAATRRGDQVLPVLIHGDAAFAGQGVVQETLQPVADARLLHRRHDPHRRQQPDRLHDLRSARRALDAVLHRRREDGRGADLPRQRRRSRRRALLVDRARARLPAASSTRTWSSTSSATAGSATTRRTSRRSRSR